MSRVFLISDLHFGHKNMALKRGFKDEVEHDEHIIKMWNSVVTKRDIVYLLGDVTMEKSQPYEKLGRLRGVIRVVGGNHDKPGHTKKLLEYVESVSGMVEYKGYILTHCPIHESEIDWFRANIHGHVHEKSLPDERYINVSCEAVNYTPVEFSQIEKATLM